MATMRDVAALAGVSIGTVSNVINGLPHVTKKNREKVLSAVKELGFVPSHTARSLKTRASKSIGLIIPDILNPFYPEITRGAADAASRLGYAVFFCNSDRDAEKERVYLSDFRQKDMDGVILVKSQLPLDDITGFYSPSRVMLVDMRNPPEPEQGFGVVELSDYDGMRSVVKLLYDNGHRRIAYIAGRMDSPSAAQRISAYRDFVGQYCPEALAGNYIADGDYSPVSGYASAKALLALNTPPTAIVCANDLMAIGALKAAREAGVSVPSQLSITGFDDIGMAALCAPPLTTVQTPKYDVGRLSVELLVERLNTPASQAASGFTKVLAATLLERESTAVCLTK